MEDKGRKRISPVLIVAVLVILFGGVTVYWVTSPGGSGVVGPDSTGPDGAGPATFDGSQHPGGSGSATTSDGSVSASDGSAGISTNSGGGDVAAQVSEPGLKSTETPSEAYFKQVDEETFIRLSVDVVIAAMGFKNVGQGNRELIDYMPELYKKYGVTEDAYKEAADLISADKGQSERVAKAIVDRAEKITGVKMDMSVLPVMNPKATGAKPAAGAR